MATVTLHSAAGTHVLSDDEVAVLFFAYDFAAHQPYGTGGSALSRLTVSGGSFDLRACGQLLAFCKIAREKVAPVELEVWKRKYGSNTCLGSETAHGLVVRYKLAYRNLNTEPPAIFIGRTRKDALTSPQRIADLPPFVSGLQTVETAARTGSVVAEHSDPKVFFCAAPSSEVGGAKRRRQTSEGQRRRSRRNRSGAGLRA